MPEDELARRRAERARQAAQGEGHPGDAYGAQPVAGRGRQPAGRPGAGDPDPQAGEPLQPDWKDVLAMIIAAYQVIMPVVLAFIGAVLLVYLAFRFLFLR